MKKSVLSVSIALVLMLAIPMLTVLTSAQVTVPKGPWVDEIVFFKEADEAKGIDMLLKEEMHAYYFPIRDTELFKKVKASPDLWYALSYGSYNELTFNPVGPEFPATGKLNPFCIPRIREAMNYIVDRKYIAEEISGGLAVPRTIAIPPSFPDYARLVDVARKIEIEYSYNFEKAKAIITEEMERLGAKLVGGKWNYKGEPVTLIFLIRIEDERRDIGDYVSTQLEKIGFTIDRQYKTSKEAALLWLRGDPADGKWHIYTGGWVTTVISRDEGDNFGFFYTPRGLTRPLWLAYKPDPEFDYIAERLWNRDYTTWEERNELMARALELSMKDSVRVWLVNRISPWVARKEIELASDLAGGFYGSRMWPYTFRFKDQVGGSAKIASLDILVQPWNPVGGSNWIYDQMIIRATYDSALIADPFTGLFWPQRIKKAEVYVKRGLPVTKTLDWVDLSFLSEITVPADAWYGWNATTQEIIYAPPETMAKTKTVVYFNDDLFKSQYHDGTKMSLADFVFNFILTFDRADPASPIYDEAYVPAFKSFRETFKGFKIVKEDPLVIEYYTDVIYPDAEWIAAEAADAFDPEMAFGPSPWHMVAIGWLAEKDKKLAFTEGKAAELKVDQINYISGPSIPILEEKLEEALATEFIPYEKELGAYVSKAEAKAKYEGLKSWYEKRGHFWVGYGPFYLHSVDTVASIVVIKAFREHPDRADKWMGFAEPKLAEVSVSGPSTIIQALAAEFTIEVTYKGEPYKTRYLDFVKYIMMGPAGEVTAVGTATPVKDGEWKFVLSAADTSLLPTGSNKIEVIAASKLVSIPTSGETSFVTMTFGEYLSGELGKQRAELEAAISGIETSISELQGQVSDLQASVSTLSTITTASLIIALIAIVIAVIIVVIRKK